MTRRVDVAAVVAGVRERSPRALARALSLVESGSPDAADLLAALGAPSSDRRAIVVGITGAPGVGKSTTKNAIVRELTSRGRVVGVLAVDPSSHFSGG
ncbi:MAG: methylmalonyl Co-A mutase-associated GTPase MeaB, partial [Tetrasphaera sp.]|nr:methylmalonyl Co-A mutase-associated GTPase MeaB [Tetrasphaera sp.]